MKAIDATPPKNMPAQVIVMDRELAKRHPSKAFYLRLAKGKGDDVDIVDLDGAVTPIDARRIAADKGYAPTHWMDAANGIQMRF